MDDEIHVHPPPGHRRSTSLPGAWPEEELADPSLHYLMIGLEIKERTSTKIDKKSEHLSVCLSVGLSVCLSVCLSVSGSLSLSLSLCLCLSLSYLSRHSSPISLFTLSLSLSPPPSLGWNQQRLYFRRY